MTFTIHRVESEGSHWEFDDDLNRYRRWPKGEGPRENPNWAEPGTPLEDAVWHDMLGWGAHPHLPYLCIQCDPSTPDYIIRAPITRGIWAALNDWKMFVPWSSDD